MRSQSSSSESTFVSVDAGAENAEGSIAGTSVAGAGAGVPVVVETLVSAEVTELSVLPSRPCMLARCRLRGLPMKASEVSSRSFGLGFSLGMPAFVVREFGELEVGESEDLRWGDLLGLAISDECWRLSWELLAERSSQP